MSRPVAICCAVLLLASGCGGPSGDADRGEKLHADCVGCHGTELYAATARKVKSPGELKKAVEQWNDSMNPKFSEQEVADLIAYLDRDFYRFR